MLKVCVVGVCYVIVWVVLDVVVGFGNAMYVHCVEFEVLVGVSVWAVVVVAEEEVVTCCW